MKSAGNEKTPDAFRLCDEGTQCPYLIQKYQINYYNQSICVFKMLPRQW